ncbi:M56 family metallopeptidase [Rhodanobacter sp. C03]|uniref:M56 family metallopeptidase n=1 Tax=Rhodanobacter sp. C03 TaxID=1945858 RepID=UPI00098759E9|nr:M56 family metallopeptidase [Rhodanobacter sp. C03]OOG57339.1 energy transducer TonB [Rhodanobacter sp. C03]
MFVMLLYVTFGLLLVLTLRWLARQWFGAGPAFTLWLLPPLLAMLPWLPTLPSAWAVTPTLLVLPTTPSFVAQVMPASSRLPWPLLLWLAGTVCCLLRLTFHYGRLRRQSCRLPAAMCHTLQRDLHGLDPLRLRLHPAGPAVLWAPRSLVLLPASFLERFDADERRLVLQHEYMHLRRGDALWSLLAELAVALLWFHPLAWLALPRLRLDQELACDERVLRQSPQDETKYAYTLLHSTGMDATPVLIPWLDQPQLKERLNMIQRHRPGALRRRIGFVGLTALIAASAFVAQAAVHTKPDHPASTDLSFNTNINPRYPADAIKNHQQGTVILDVLVGTDGKPREVKVNPATQAAPSLIKAASDVAMQWRFNPATKNGKRIQSYARVPINFSLTETPTETPVPATAPPKSPVSS